jgi:hypothetical protein
MKIVGYFIHGNKQYVAFKDKDDGRPERYQITDGFHDRPVNENNLQKYQGYRPVQKSDINLQKIVKRMRSTRPWHPLLDVLKNEVVA